MMSRAQSRPHLANATEEELLAACATNDLDALEQLFPRSSTSQLYEPLDVAVRSGFVDLVRFLWDHMEERDVEGYWHARFPLHAACEQGYVEMVEFLMDRMSDFAVCGYDDLATTPLNRACGCHDHASAMAIVLLLAERITHRYLYVPCNSYIKENMQGTPLHVACQRGNVEVSRYFIERVPKHELFAQDFRGRTPLGRLFMIPPLAQEEDRHEIMKTFFETITAREVVETSEEMRVSLARLWKVILASGDTTGTEMMFMWLDASELVQGDPLGVYPLHVVCGIEDFKTTQFLIERLTPQSFEGKDLEGKTALHIAAEVGAAGCLEVLLPVVSQECLFATCDQCGFTAANYAAAHHPALEKRFFQPRAKSACS